MAKRTLENIYSRVAAATMAVGPPQRRGQGVYVGNGYIITAAHCLKYDNNTGIRIVMEEQVLYKVETAQGERFYVAPLVIESCSDIAVLGALDGQIYPPEMVEPFEAFCDRTKPVPLCRRRLFNFQLGMKTERRLIPAVRSRTAAMMKFQPEEFRVHIRSHKKTWITGKVTVFWNRQSKGWVKADNDIEGGTSGGPIINDAGELVGVVSTSSDGNSETKEGSFPFASWALPAWIYHRICGKET